MNGPPKKQRSSNRPSQYRTFDPTIKLIRDATITALLKEYFDHIAKNEGKCKRGFVKNLIDNVNKTVSYLGITPNI